MNHFGPRLIVNDVGAWSSNLLHGVKLGLFAPAPRALAASMASSITLLSAEIEGRAYGGGVLKLETREAERLLIPVGTPAQLMRLTALFPDIDALVQGGDTETAARTADDALGIDRDRIWEACLTFRTRRLGRRRVRVA